VNGWSVRRVKRIATQAAQEVVAGGGASVGESTDENADTVELVEGHIIRQKVGGVARATRAATGPSYAEARVVGVILEGGVVGADVTSSKDGALPVKFAAGLTPAVGDASWLGLDGEASTEPPAQGSGHVLLYLGAIKSTARYGAERLCTVAFDLGDPQVA